ncbi:hypothetical protein FOA52_008349 [Chlamydomonas sp. UWO 241]|nr:hypothetical protein FOA52_008349 [Chlamydomonas sp. UWO 241]
MWLQGCYSRRTNTPSDADQGLRLLQSGGGALQSPACIVPAGSALAAAKPADCGFGGVLCAGSQAEEAGGSWLIVACPAPPSSPTSIRVWRPSLYSVPEHAAAEATIGMSMYQAALIEAEEASAHATAVSHAVLFSRDLWRDQLWQWLDCGSKRAPRATSVEMHDQVDAALRKLDLRDCGSLLQSQVGNLQLSCTELAHPSTVELEGLVDKLQPCMTAFVQAGAARALAKRAGSDDQNQVAIAAAGTIPPLVQLLGQHSTADVQKAAAGALGQLAADDRENTAAIVAAGAIPALMQLRGQSPAPGMRRAAADRLLVLGGPGVQ